MSISIPRGATRRHLLLAGLGAAAAMGATKARAAGASRPISLIVPYPPGGGVDMTARAVAERMGQLLGTTIVVDNRPGGSTSIASAFVARAEPDGQTLLLGTPALSVNAVFQPSLPPGDPRKVLQPVGPVATLPYVLVSGPALPAEDLPGLIAWAKAHPGALNIANSGAITAPRLAGELLAQQTGIKITSVPYKGGAAASLDIAAGRVHCSFLQTVEAMALIRQGGRPLAVSSEQRAPILRDVPAMAEYLPGFDVTSWNGLYVPAGTPQAVVQRLNAALNTAISDETLRQRFAEEGITFTAGTPEALGERLDREIGKWTRLQQAANLVLE